MKSGAVDWEVRRGRLAIEPRLGGSPLRRQSFLRVMRAIIMRGDRPPTDPRCVGTDPQLAMRFDGLGHDFARIVHFAY